MKTTEKAKSDEQIRLEKEEAFNKKVSDKSEELSKKLDCKVNPIVITYEDEKVVGYFQEPSYDVLMYAVDAYKNNEVSKAAEAAFADGILKDESDERITSDKRKHAKIKASFTTACIRFVTPMVNEYSAKKKQ
jgi:hypothetical protein